jgi:ankyrin repeat protein
MTALGVASLYGHADVVTALIAAGANVNADQDGESALALASQAGHVAVVDALLAAKADITAKDKDGMTALMAAAAANRAAVVRTLVSHGADVNGANPDGATALMAAAFGGHVEAAQALLTAGANVNSRARWERCGWARVARSQGRLERRRPGWINSADLRGCQRPSRNHRSAREGGAHQRQRHGARLRGQGLFHAGDAAPAGRRREDNRAAARHADARAGGFVELSRSD